MRLPFYTAVLFLLLSSLQGRGQASYNFRHLSATQGLADGVVRAIGQDKYGYIWVSTLSGVNRFNGYSVQRYHNDPKDSFSLPPYNIRSFALDAAGRFWLGGNRGFSRYDYTTNRFERFPQFAEYGVFRIIPSGSEKLFLQTHLGLVVFAPASGQMRHMSGPNKELEGITDIFLSGAELLVATSKAVYALDTRKEELRRLSLPIPPDLQLNMVARDGRGNYWLSAKGSRSVILQIDPRMRSVRLFDDVAYSQSGFVGGSAFKFLVDGRGEFWFTTSLNGLGHYNEKTGRLEFITHDPVRQGSLSTNHVTEIFQGKNGFMWIGTEGYGVNYFHPQQNLFQTILPPLMVMNEIPSVWVRDLAVDSSGAQWMALGSGLIRQKGSEYRFYRNRRGDSNVIHNNSVRQVMIDRRGTVWVGTALGVNQIDRAGRVRFLGDRDSLPQDFYWSVLEDSRGTIWFGAKSRMFYWAPGARTAHSLAGHPVLSPLLNQGVHCIFEDSKRRLWFGMNGDGVALYDPARNTLRQWRRANDSDTTLVHNVVLGIAEDRSGVMWFTSFTGLTSFDPVAERFRIYTSAQGMPSVKTSSILVDARNRLWIGSTAGLLVLDSARQRFKSFDEKDGLPTMEFTDMPGEQLPGGDFVMSTMKGFLRFDPLAYTGDARFVDVVLSSLRVNGRPYSGQNAEELRSLDLSWNENFLTFELTGFNYNNPEQTWYAYQLEGFDKEWIYTKDRFVNYTNVPGGTYTFRFKATSDPNNWNVPEKSIRLHIGTVFYKATWFWIAFAALTLLALFLVYRFRLRQQKRIFRLQTRAQALEKEKTLVMYESLKQQLNPHFLFNSLTSLASLIKIDQKLASGFLDGMSKMYRYILKSSDNELVPLGEEVRFVEHYIRLQKIRFEYGLEVSIEVPEDYHYRRIAPVTLQNLIENAIKHNVIDDEQPLEIRVFVEDDHLVVRNNLQRKKFVETSNKQGLASLTTLYRYFSKKPVAILESEHHFTVKIPLL